MQNRCLIQLYRRGRNGTELSGVFQKLADVLLLFGDGQTQITFYIIFEKVPKTGCELFQGPVRRCVIVKGDKGIHFITEGPVRVYVIVKIHPASLNRRGFSGLWRPR